MCQMRLVLALNQTLGKGSATHALYLLDHVASNGAACESVCTICYAQSLRLVLSIANFFVPKGCVSTDVRAV